MLKASTLMEISSNNMQNSRSHSDSESENRSPRQPQRYLAIPKNYLVF